MVHLGHNIAKLRGIRRLPQKDIAKKLSMTQQEYSKVEKSASVDEDKLILIAEALDVSLDAIKNFNDEAAINIFNTNTTLNDNSAANIGNKSVNTFNPIEKLMEMVDENKKLYQQLLKEKDTVIQMYKQQKGS
ncbi:helix-turn-helix domain-containing protein [Mucilaginibacter gracilis]|nr:helix-turn-helix transcriptional regulator [Mucilaginibacter gracilis]